MEKFLQQLKLVPKKWLVHEGYIRTVDGECPICAVYNHLMGGIKYKQIWVNCYKALGLSYDEGMRIATAADNKSSRNVRELLCKSLSI